MASLRKLKYMWHIMASTVKTNAVTDNMETRMNPAKSKTICFSLFALSTRAVGYVPVH